MWFCHHNWSQGRDFAGFTTMPQQQPPQSQMPSQAYPNYAISPPHVSFVFQNWASHWFMLYVGFYYGVSFLLSGSHVAAMFTSWGSNSRVCIIVTLRSIPLWHSFYCHTPHSLGFGPSTPAWVQSIIVSGSTLLYSTLLILLRMCYLFSGYGSFKWTAPCGTWTLYRSTDSSTSRLTICNVFVVIGGNQHYIK